MRQLLTICFVFIFLNVFGQNDNKEVRTSNFPEIKKLKFTDIPGAVRLTQPIRIDGTKQEIRTEKHGLIYPALFDWNKDGKPDLILGEFETSDTLSNLQVHINIGSKKKPRFSGEFFYARDINGKLIANSQWCCIGIHPRFVDLDQDGYMDILSGQYNPGAISWWRGSENGFLPKQFVEQEGWQVDEENMPEGITEARHASKRGSAPWEPENFMYWNYTTTDFADFNGDGLLDLFVGGLDLRVALNTGTKENPKFGLRNWLYHVNGDILNVHKPTPEEIKWYKEKGQYPSYSGAGKAYLKPIDWDNDGVLDILITHTYKKKGHFVVTFFRGVNTDDGLRFEEAKPLFVSEDGSKEFPGCQPMLTIGDYNGDKINDLIIGISIPTINGFEYAEKAGYTWIEDARIEMPGKDAGRQIKYLGGFDVVSKDPGKAKMYSGVFNDINYLTLRHRGYAFVLQGKKPNAKTIAKTAVAHEKFVPKKLTNKNIKQNQYDKVAYSIEVPKRISYWGNFEIVAKVKFDDGWNGYVDNEANVGEGFIPTKLSIEWPEWLLPVGDMEMPAITQKGLTKVYKGEVIFKQKFQVKKIDQSSIGPAPQLDYDNATEKEIAEFQKVMKKWYEEFAKLPQPPNSFNVKVKLQWQTCDKDMCLPPVKIQDEFKLIIAR